MLRDPQRRVPPFEPGTESCGPRRTNCCHVWKLSAHRSESERSPDTLGTWQRSVRRTSVNPSHRLARTTSRASNAQPARAKDRVRATGSASQQAAEAQEGRGGRAELELE